MDWTFALLLLLFAVLIMLAPMYRSSKSFHKNMFSAAEVASVGVASNVEVFALQDQEFGQLVGLVFKGADSDLRLSITLVDALLLAQMLETEAREASLIP
jgi:hypothetical protein